MMQTILFNMVTKGMLLLEIGLPLIFWGLKKEKDTSFPQWIGWVKPKRTGGWRLCIVFAAVYYLHVTLDLTKFYDEEILRSLGFLKSDSIILPFWQQDGSRGVKAVQFLTFFFPNFITNCLAVEFFYRGFLCRRFCERFGKMKGLAFHALLFGLMQTALYFLLRGTEFRKEWFFYAVVLVVPSFAAGGFLTGFLNEKIFNGSILPGICLQAAGLILTSFLMVSGGGMQAEPIEISGSPAGFAAGSEYIIFETDEPPV